MELGLFPSGRATLRESKRKNICFQKGDLTVRQAINVNQRIKLSQLHEREHMYINKCI